MKKHSSKIHIETGMQFDINIESIRIRVLYWLKLRFSSSSSSNITELTYKLQGQSMGIHLKLKNHKPIEDICSLHG